MKIDFGKAVPHIIAILVFLIITVAFFHPVFFENKEIFQHDILQGQGAAQSLKEYRSKSGEEGLWAENIFSGMPAYLVGMVYSGDIVVHLQSAYSLWLPHPVRILFMSFLSFYILLLSFGVRPYVAMAGALAFGLTSFQIISLGAGHNSKAAAIAIMPLVLAGVHLAFKGKFNLGFIITALGLAMEIRVNHLQITYYLLIICVGYGLSELIYKAKGGEIKSIIKPMTYLVLAAILAVGTNFGRLWGIYEYSQHSIRGKSELSGGDVPQGESGLDKAYAFEFSNGIMEPMVLFIPNFFGGSSFQELDRDSNLANSLLRNGLQPQQIGQHLDSVPTYWGDQRLSAPYYAGAITIFLFALGLLLLEGRMKWWLLGLITFSIMMSWGSSFSSFNYALFDYLPGYNKFRSVTFSIIIAIFCMGLLGFQGLDKLLSEGLTKPNQRKLLIALGTTAGFALIAAIFAGVGRYEGSVDLQLAASVPDWYINAIRLDREALLRGDAFRSFMFVMLAASAIWLGIKNIIPLKFAILGLALLIVADMFFVDKRYLKEDAFRRNPARQFFSANEADRTILQDTDPNYRVFNLINPFNDARTSYHHRSIGGYHGAKMKRYQDLIERCLSVEQQEIMQMVQSRDFSFYSQDVINMLDARYFIAGPNKGHVIPNEYANGPAWFVPKIKKVNNADEEIEAIGNANTKTIAIVDVSKFPVEKEDYFSGGTIEVVKNEPNQIVYEIDAAGESFALFSQIYYPEGWTATIDGVNTEILRANYVLRAMLIPEGKHTVEFNFEPASYTIGNTVMLICGVLLVLLIVVIGLLEIKKLQSDIQQ
ncbi:MAG: YfhO family protein [Cyclobacteriaceae bacterium]